MINFIHRSQVNRHIPTMHFGIFQFSGAVWVGGALVALAIVMVAAAPGQTTSSTCEMVKFRQSKSASGGAVQCATAPAPTATVTRNTRMECSRECANNADANCAAGFNYKQAEAACEMFNSAPSTLEVQQDCQFWKVCTLLATCT